MGQGSTRVSREVRTAKRAAEWGERVAAWRKSGLSVATYCKREGLATHSLYYWRQRRSPRPLPVSPPPPGERPPSPAGQVSGPSFIALKLPGVVRSACSFELETARGLLRVPMGFDADSLRRLLEVLGAMRCG